jgi:large subunit ribosomal protein L10
MENPRPEKVAVVNEVRRRFSESDAVLLTEYRGIKVSEMAQLRAALRQAGGEYTVYKNTLVRFAARDLGLDLEDQLTGPTAIAFVPTGGGGDPVSVAKALREFAKGNPNLVIKGGVLGEKLLSAGDADALADVAPREELLARLAGLIAAPMQQFAGLLQAVPRSFAYGLAALIEQKGGAPEESAPAAEESAEAEAPAADAEVEDAPAAEEAAADDTAADDTAADTPEAAASDATETPEASADADAAPEAQTDDAPADAEADTQEG